ncbi:YIP1 family protein [bacterium]|nr:YIP1 family protein [bacterium]
MTIAWENTYNKDIVKRFIDTIKTVFTKPVQFFNQLPPTGGYKWPLIFGVICQSFGILLSVGYHIGFHSMSAPGFFIPGWLAPFGIIGIIFFALFGILGSIFAAIFSLLFFAGTFHLMLKIVGVQTRGFEATLRVVAYSSATQLIALIPFLGVVIAGVWRMILNVIGFKEVHQTTYGKIIFAILLPILVCCGGGLLIFTMVMGGIFAAAIGGAF